VTDMRGEMLYRTVEEITTGSTAPAYVYRNHWWAVDRLGRVALYHINARHSLHPQCNPNRAVIEVVGPKTLGEDYAGVVQLPLAFVPKRWTPA
jgi:hypothetical protein